LSKRIPGKGTFCPKSLSLNLNIYCKHLKKKSFDIRNSEREKKIKKGCPEKLDKWKRSVLN